MWESAAVVTNCYKIRRGLRAAAPRASNNFAVPAHLAAFGIAAALAVASATALAQHGGGKGRGGPGRPPPAQPRFERMSPPPQAPGPQHGRMSPEQREQLRRDIQDANRNIDRR